MDDQHGRLTFAADLSEVEVTVLDEADFTRLLAEGPDAFGDEEGTDPAEGAAGDAPGTTGATPAEGE